jgi:hypothetical protein
MLTVIAGFAVTVWIVAELVVQQEPKRWKAVLKILAGACSLALVWPAPVYSRWEAKACFIFGIAACLVGSVEMVVALLAKEQNSKQHLSSEPVAGPPPGGPQRDPQFADAGRAEQRPAS